jgi:hypothetical protein
LENENLTSLSSLGDTRRGVMTGANDFFFISDDDLETWPINERFLKPAIKSIREADEQVLSEGDTDKYLFDMYEFVEEVKRDTTGVAADSDLGQRVRDALDRGGYATTKQYIEWGESEEFHTRRSCEGRDAWFNLGQLDGPEILHPKFFNERVFTIWNRDRLMPSNAIDCIDLDDDVDETVVMGILNSTVHKALLECWGRAEGGGALQLMTYELSSLPVLDVRGLAGEVAGEIADANQALIDGEDDAQERLDQIILDALDVNIDTERLQELQETMMQKRVSSGAEVEVLVEHMEGLEEGGTQAFVKNSDGNQSLSDYMS